MSVKPQGISVCLVLTRLVNPSAVRSCAWTNAVVQLLFFWRRKSLRQLHTCGGREHVGLRQALLRGEAFCVWHVRTSREISLWPQKVCRSIGDEIPVSLLLRGGQTFFLSHPILMTMSLFPARRRRLWRGDIQLQFMLRTTLALDRFSVLTPAADGFFLS